MQSSKVDARDSLVEGFALNEGELLLVLAGLARSVTTSEGTGTPWGTTADLRMVGENAESVLVAQRNEDHSVMDKGRHGVRGSDLLPTALGTGGDENADVFAVKSTTCPEAAGSVDECLPLTGEVTITSGDTEEESVVIRQIGGFDGVIRRLLRGVHGCKNLRAEGLGDLVDGSFSSGLFNTLLFLFGKLGDMVVQRVDDDTDFRSHCCCLEVVVGKECCVGGACCGEEGGVDEGGGSC
jgi:hypothetical protein